VGEKSSTKKGGRGGPQFLLEVATQDVVEPSVMVQKSKGDDDQNGLFTGGINFNSGVESQIADFDSLLSIDALLQVNESLSNRLFESVNIFLLEDFSAPVCSRHCEKRKGKKETPLTS
jgi:hypothetical protein